MKNHSATWNKLSLSFIKKGMKFILLHLSMQFFIPPTLRTKLLKLYGIQFKNSKTVFIGTNVITLTQEVLLEISVQWLVFSMNMNIS